MQNCGITLNGLSGNKATGIDKISCNISKIAASAI
jgi:hypothetical protein